MTRTSRLLILGCAVLYGVVVLPFAQASMLQLHVTYTDGHIVSGPLSADLTELPESVLASFTLDGAGARAYGLADVLQSSLVFGDGAWNAADFESFSATMLRADGGEIVVTSLSYAYAAKDTATTLGRIARNFPLNIQGTDRASGDAFEYQYETSTQAVTVAVPEPGSLGLWIVSGVCSLVVKPWRQFSLSRSQRRRQRAAHSVSSRQSDCAKPSR